MQKSKKTKNDKISKIFPTISQNPLDKQKQLGYNSRPTTARPTKRG
jgi:hypothetical protein